MEMEDFESALNPDEFEAFIAQLKTAEKALGNFNVEEDFGMSEAEKTYRKNVRRDVVALHEIGQGEKLNVQNLTLKRTANEESINQLELVLGKSAKNPIQKNQAILTKDIH